MIYLKNFETTEEYDSYIAGEPIFPNVSLTEDDNKVHYLKRKPLATNFIPGNYYIPEAEYFLEIWEDIKKLVDDELRWHSIKISTGLLDNTIDVSHYSWFSYLSTPLYENDSEITKFSFYRGKYVTFNSFQLVINPKFGDFGECIHQAS